MKKFIVIALIAVLVPLAVFADAFDFILGGEFQYNGPVDGLVDDMKSIEDFKEVFSKFNAGLEARVKLAIVNVNVSAKFAENTEAPADESFFNKLLYSGTVTAGFAFDLGNAVRLGIGAGTTVAYNPITGAFLVGNENLAEESFDDAIKYAPIVARASVDLLLGKVVMLGVNAEYDTGISYKTIKHLAEQDPTVEIPEFDVGKVRVGLFLGFRIV